MMFLNAILLWAIPAALLPVIIHLLNRLRYKSVSWAAMMFLISATRSSTRNAKLRHYLILACRCLAILMFVLAVSRPMIGGWFGATLAGAPDTIVILLDRSASMETADPNMNRSKRAEALKVFAQAGRESASGSRYVLIENATLTPQEIAGPSVLPELTSTGPTDTAADIPAMMQQALEYMIDNQTGRTEIWIASDLQASNWRPDSDRWDAIANQIDALPQDVRVRLLVFPDAAGRNVSVGLAGADRRKVGDTDELALMLDLNRTTKADASFPFTMILDGARSPDEMDMQALSLRQTKTVELSEKAANGGWGKVELPADENVRDNAAFFVYGLDVPLHAIAVTQSRLVSRYFTLSVAPSRAIQNRSCQTLAPVQLDEVDWNNLALLMWQEGAPSDAVAASLDAFVRAGGSIICFPPNKPNIAGPFGMQWGILQNAEEDAPYKVSLWERYDGPLADADNFELPVGDLAVKKRQAMSEESQDGDWAVLARFSDGHPLLMRKIVERGRVYACSTLPEKEWSNLGMGPVLVPMIQRVLQDGGRRLRDAQFGDCGSWRPEVADQVWTSVDSEEARDPRWDAGVYRHGDTLVALNRPTIEDDPEVTERKEALGLFGSVPVQILEESVGKVKDQTQSEIWPLFIYLALAFLIGEALLLLSERTALSKETQEMKSFHSQTPNVV